MYGWILCGVLLIILIILFLRYNKKQELDRTERYHLEADIELLQQEKRLLNDSIEELNEKSNLAIERYNNSIRDKTEELESYFAGQKRRRQEIMDADMLQREQELNKVYDSQKECLILELRAFMDDLSNQADEVQEETNTTIEDCIERIQEIENSLKAEQERYEGLLAPIRQYEMEKQERLYYTIQLPEEYHEDIEFLLTTVAEKVQHPDIISKLVWSEYVKNYLADTCMRVDIREEPGIYKLTSLINGKSYIGKSTNIKKRIQDHFKSVVGIQSIADQAVHHAILKEGFWNWTIEVITYCDKEKLNELEKYYIEFFKTQEYGWNRNSGGGG